MAAKKKISIDEAFKALEQAGLKVKIEKVEEKPKPSQETPSFVIQEPIRYQAKPDRRFTKRGPAKVPLFAKHEINGLNYGPGIIEVPDELVSQLMYQDRKAREADNRTFDNQQRSYLIVKMQNSNGVIAYRGVRVPSLDFNILPQGNMVEL